MKTWFYNICTVLAGFIVTQTGNVDAVRFETRHVLEHEHLVIQCNTYGRGGMSEFFWFKHGMDGGSSVHYGTGRSLDFVDIRKEATAVYVCHAFNSYKSEYVTVSAVKVYVESRVDAAHIKTKHIVEYENLKIQCDTSGLADLDLNDFFWIKNGTGGNNSVYYGSGRSLDFVDIHLKASGVYICHALTKTMESFAISAIKVEVQLRVDAAHLETRHVLEHENLTLQCNTSGLADLRDFFWTKNGTGGNRGDYYGSGRSLDFVNIHKEATGVYVCHARYTLKNNTRESLAVSAVKVDVQLRVDATHIETKHVMEHENLEIKCNTTGLADLKDLFWIKNGTGDNSSVYYGSGRSLDFVDIHIKDTGVYVCHALNNNTRERLTVSAIQLVVHLRVAHMETMHVLEHRNLTLHCNTSGLADIRDFVWIKDGNGYNSGVYSGSGRSLDFVDIQKEDTGVYACHAKNAPNSNTRERLVVSSVKVDVQYPAEVRSFSLEPRSILSSQFPAVGCGFYGNPEPTWSIFNRDNGHVILSMNHSHEVHMPSFPIRCGDTGMWVCSGFNALTHGVNASRGYELTVLCPPIPDPDIRPTYTYKAVVGDTVAMRLDIQASPDPAYFWSRDDGQVLGVNVSIQNGPRSTALWIYDVHDSDFGDYTLKMNNSIGSYDAHFTLKNRAINKPDQDQHILAAYVFGFTFGPALLLLVCGGAYYMRKWCKKWYPQAGNDVRKWLGRQRMW